MCGIAGWQIPEESMSKGNLTVLATSLIQSNENRGPDSFGVAYPTDDGRVAIEKDVGKITLKLDVESILRPTICIHTRRATAGVINEKNAHPWAIDGIVAAHNGIIHDHGELNKRHKTKYEVDSQILIHYVANEMPLKDLSGWGAMWWYKTTDPSTIFIARAEMGDLAVAGIGKNPEKVKGIVFSSDDVALERALTMAGFPFFMYKVGYGRFYRIADGVYWKGGKFPLSQGRITYAGGATTYYGRGKGCGGERDWENSEAWRNRHKFMQSQDGDKAGDGKVIQLPGPVHTPELPYPAGTNGQATTPLNVDDPSTIETDEQCHSCLEWGPIVVSHAEGNVGVLYYEPVKTWLCEECAAWCTKDGVIDGKLIVRGMKHRVAGNADMVYGGEC